MGNHFEKTYEHFSGESEKSKKSQQNQKNPKNESATKTCIRLHEMMTPMLRFCQKYRKYDKISGNPTQKSNLAATIICGGNISRVSG